MHIMYKLISVRFILLLALAGYLSLTFSGSCKSGAGSDRLTPDSLKRLAEKDWNRTIPGNFSSQTISSFDSLEIGRFLKQYPDLASYEKSIRTFYRNRNMAFAWFDKEGLIEHAGNLADRIMNLEDEGISKPIPYYQALDSMMYGSVSPELTVSQKIKLELMLTAQYFAFANTAWEGTDISAAKATNWYLPRKKISYGQYLDSLLSTKSEEDWEYKAPVYRQYELLRKYLVKYRKLDQHSKWFLIKAGSKSYRPGDSSIVIAQVKQKLFDLGDYSGDTLNKYYDALLEKAVRQFQFRHGLKDDGIISRSAFDELNIPYKTRIRQILVNMERSRWLPVKLNSDYLVVNIPEFKLHVYHADSLLWSCNVVVGQAVHKTAVFSGELKYVVFRPYWNVPRSIVVNEVLPAMRKNSGYISRNNMEITGYRDGLPEIRQKPGPHNALGLVKFLFPNSYNIYLHDTPAKSLFGESSRAFSHGCIRISEPEKLANFLLRNDPSWDQEKIRSAMDRGSERYVTLKEKTPVFIAYFTAFVDRSGRINFRKDIYNRDERLADMILEEL